jgi:glucosyl-dolichyl phosphate glucuronosyltransferase
VSLRVSVVVCTWNRASLLRQALEGMTRLAAPADAEWKLLVVNNRSTDDTDEVIASFAGRLPIRRLWEERPGLSNARNRALAEATGDYVVWTDDDVLVDGDWLAAYCRAFRRWPEADLFGGPIEPLFEGGAPAWIERVLDRIGPVFGRQTLGKEPVRLTPDVLPGGPYGGNMAMRRAALLRFPFDPALGVRHGAYGIGEETQVMTRMLEAGLEGWWTPEPRVRHWIPRASQTPGYVRRWYVGCGEGELRMAGPLPRLSAGRAYLLLKKAIRSEIRYRVARRTGPPEEWIGHLARAGKLHGEIRGLVRARAERGSA